MMARESVMLAIALATGLVSGCAGARSAGSGNGNGDGAINGDGGGGGDDGGTSLPGDALPTGAISFFNGPTCPDGWDLFAPSVGRALVPTVGAGQPGLTAGMPLQSGEDRKHGHAIAAQLAPRSVSFAGIAGESNHGAAGAQAAGFSTTGDPVSAGLPYVQLLVCKKSAAPVVRPAPLPKGTLMFFSEAGCPSGWIQAAATQGRLLVGLPPKAIPGLGFGGAALASQEKRAHHHAVSGTVTTMPHGIALASGCCAGGYLENGAYPYTADSDDSESGLPYLQLLQCQKQ